MIEKKRLHLGCGLITPDGWINMDGSWNAWMAKYPFIRKFIEVFKFVPTSQTSIDWNREIFIDDIRKPLPSLKTIRFPSFIPLTL